MESGFVNDGRTAAPLLINNPYDQGIRRAAPPHWINLGRLGMASNQTGLWGPLGAPTFGMFVVFGGPCMLLICLQGILRIIFQREVPFFLSMPSAIKDRGN